MSKWPLVKLGEIFSIARGGSPRPIDAFITDDAGGVNWIMIGDAVEGSKYISSTKKRIRVEGVSRSRRVNPGDLLLTNSMSFGKPYILNTSGCIHDGWLVLSPRRSDIVPDFFYHLLGSGTLYAQFAQLAAGAVVKNLNIDLVSGVKVSLPPPAEQRRIADILDKADAIRRKRKDAIALTEELLRSAFLDMFGDPVTNPKGWPVKPLSDVVREGTIVTYGIVQAGPHVDGGIPYIRTGDIKKDRIVTANLLRTSPEIALRFQRSEVRAGDLVMSIRATVGTIAVVPPNLDGANLTQGTARIAPGRDVTRAFLFEHIRAPGMQRWLQERVKGATFKEITLGALRTAPIMVPPRALQERFTAIADRVQKIVCEQECAEHGASTLFASLVHRTFNAGPASVDGVC